MGIFSLRIAIFFTWLLMASFSVAFLGTAQAEMVDIDTSSECSGQKTFEDGEQGTEVELNREYWKGYVTDLKGILTSPLRWEERDWLTATLVLGTTIGLISLDQDIRDAAQANRGETTDAISKIAGLFGEGAFLLPALGGFYMYGHLAKDGKAKETALLALESSVISSLFTTTLKFASHRHGPGHGNEPGDWDGPSFSTSNLSFPSQHATLAFAVATVVASQYKEAALVPPLAYGTATLVALSRIHEDSHWASDVFFGSAIGFFTAKAILGLHREPNDRNLSILPIGDGRRTGLLVSFNF